MNLTIPASSKASLVAVFFAAVLAAPPAAHGQPKVSITGQIRFNAIYTDVAETRGQTPITPSNVPFTSGPGEDRARKEADQIKFDARRTRLNLVVGDKMQGIDMGALVQIDFDTTEGTSTGVNARGPRLRLAYAEAKPAGFVLRVGQVRTFVSDVSDGIMGGAGYPLIVNEAAWGILNARQPGIHVAWFTALGGGRLGVGAGVEQQSLNLATASVPAGALTTSGVTLNQAEGQDVPLLATGVHYRDKLFGAFLRGAASRARFTSTSATGGAQDAASVWLGALSGDVTPFAPLTLYAQYWRSEGLNRLNIIGFPDVTVVDVDPGAGVSPETRPIDAKSWRVGAQYRLSRELRLNAVYEKVEMKATDSTFAIPNASATQLDLARSFNVNFIYRFWTNWETGLEYMRGRVGTLGATEGEFKGVLARLWYYF